MVTPTEEERRRGFKTMFNDNALYLVMKRQAVPSDVTNDPAADLPLLLRQEMQGLVGLHDIKRQMASFYHLLEFNKLRGLHGLPTQDINPHMMFTGNPGTGKTTVARMIGRLLKEAQVLPLGHVVEITPNDILGDYKWGSEIRNMKQHIHHARGGVLLINEAHNFMDHSGSTSKYWRNATTVLLEELTAPTTPAKPRFSLILTGYEKPMDQMLAQEPGLKSRIPTRFHFKDYTPPELVEIFVRQAQKQQFTLAEHCHEMLTKAMKEKSRKGANDFGNARFVENFFIETVKAISDRVSKQETVTQKDISIITPFDLKIALKPKTDIVPV